MFRSPASRIATALLFLFTLAVLTSCGGAPAQSNNVGVTKAITQITIKPQSLSLAKGNTVQLIATGTYNDGTTQDLTTSVNWQSSQQAVAVVTATGDLTAAGAGSAKVVAQYKGVSGNSAVVVGPATLVSVSVTPVQSSLPLGESEQLMANGTFSDGTTQDLTQSASWTSSGTAIAGVNGTGAAIANGIGTATISASVQDMTGSGLVTVTPAAALSLNIVPGTLSMPLGSSRQLEAIATYSDGSTQDMTGLVLWASSDPNVANVSNGGLLLAQQTGSTTISATGNSLTANADAAVVPLIAANYFDLAAAQQSGADGSIHLTNPGITGENLCAMLYVFDQNQELVECCGCTVSDSGLRTLSLTTDLTSNPLTGHQPQTGVIKVVPSDATSNPQCDPGSLVPTGVVLGWGTNIQTISNGAFQVTESKFDSASLSDGEASALVAECTFLRQLGSGQGICTCGTGD